MTMPLREFSLDDRYADQPGPALLTGTQALLRAMIEQARGDRRAGLNTAGFISGYRGSPVAAIDMQAARAARHLDAHDIRLHPAVNEDMGATMIWGTQQVDFDPAPTHEGVFALWYGKGPGVDRAGDALRHANMFGTSPRGGVLAVAGDDHLGKSSTIACASEIALMDAEIATLQPADPQEALDYALAGWAMSRHAGVWAGMTVTAEIMDATGIVAVNPRVWASPDGPDPREVAPHAPATMARRLDFERSLFEVRMPAARRWLAASGLDRVTTGDGGARFGIIAPGKAWADLTVLLGLMGIDDARARSLGLAVWKPAVTWPLDAAAARDFAANKERVVVIENKRGLIATQLTDALYHLPAAERPEIWGKETPRDEPFLRAFADLDTVEIAAALARALPEIADLSVLERLRDRRAAKGAPGATRLAYFCAGCPHNTSTNIPEGGRATAGVGCHVMNETAGRTTEGLTHMGGEGGTWAGLAPFTTRDHAFVNMGDGTYYHSGILAIRQAVAMNTPVTFKLLYNDAVAMTGGQTVDGPIDPAAMARQIAAEGVGVLAVTGEDIDAIRGLDWPAGVTLHDRAEVVAVQERLARHRGVSALIHVQTCAAEKRRRRKRGLMADPGTRLWINPRVCENCGDCSVQSNCVAVEPVETPFGEKRRINQSACNKDYSCAKGFCPSFIEIEGAELRRGEGVGGLVARAGALPEPDLPEIGEGFAALVTGVGGTGVVTVGAVLATAAHLMHLSVSALDMTGLAQKGGAVTTQLRLSSTPLTGARIPPGGVDALIACDALVAASAEQVALLDPARSRAVINDHIAPTAHFTRDGALPFQALSIKATLARETASMASLDAEGAAERLLGDAIFSNMIMVGAAWQAGLLPLSHEAIDTAIGLNGVAVERNREAFAAGRLLIGDPGSVAAPGPAAPMDDEARAAFLGAELVAYQGRRYAARFERMVARAGDGPPGFARAAMETAYRLMAYKDEYEVARLWSLPESRAAIEAVFAEGGRRSLLMAPPLLTGTDPATGRPRKRRFGPWIFPVLRRLSRLRFLRGTPFDPFGRTAERRMERGWIRQFEDAVETVAARGASGDPALALAIARAPMAIRGYGPVKQAAADQVEAAFNRLLTRFRDDRPAVAAE